MNASSTNTSTINTHEESKQSPPEEEEEEEVLVYVQFDHLHEANTLLKAVHGGEIQQLLDTAADSHPTCIVDGIPFTGQHEINLGTVLFFGTKDQDANQIELIGSTERVLKFAEHTVETLKQDPIIPEHTMEIDEETTQGLAYVVV